jgi:polyisoprenoid-binding protein YceI
MFSIFQSNTGILSIHPWFHMNVEGTNERGEDEMAQAVNDIAGIQAPPAGRYELDRAHTAVEFVARHILTKVRGRFTDFSGWIEVGEDPADSKLEVVVETASIQTNTEQRDQHLKSDDFLNVERWPVMTFRSTAVRRTGGAGFEIDGELTIRDVTRPITLTGDYLGIETNPSGKTILAATARATLQREDWNVSWNMVLETGGFLVSRQVELEIEVEAIKVD